MFDQIIMNYEDWSLKVFLSVLAEGESYQYIINLFLFLRIILDLMDFYQCIEVPSRLLGWIGVFRIYTCLFIRRSRFFSRRFQSSMLDWFEASIQFHYYHHLYIVIS